MRFDNLPEPDSDEDNNSNSSDDNDDNDGIQHSSEQARVAAGKARGGE